MSNGVYYGHGEDSSAQSAANDALSKARRAGSDLEELRRRLDRMALFNEALWVILRDRVGISEAELFDMAREIDLSDGKLDGKARQAPVRCPGCDRIIGARHHRCIYCGTEVVRPPFGSI